MDLRPRPEPRNPRELLYTTVDAPAPTGPPPFEGMSIRARDDAPMLDGTFLTLRIPDTCLLVSRFSLNHWVIQRVVEHRASAIMAVADEIKPRPILVVSEQDSWAQRVARVVGRSSTPIRVDTQSAPLAPCVRAVSLVGGDGRLWIAPGLEDIRDRLTHWDGGHNENIRPVMALGQLFLAHDKPTHVAQTKIWGPSRC